MEWLEDDEMVRQWEDAFKEEEQIMMRRNEGRGLSVERVQHAPELMVLQGHM